MKPIKNPFAANRIRSDDAPDKKGSRGEALGEITREILRRRRIGERLKTSVDQDRAEQKRLRTEAMAALEAGDALWAQFLCSQIKIKRLASQRNSTLYLLNLRVCELLSQKEICLKSFAGDMDLSVGNDLLDSAELDRIVDQLRSLDVDISLWTESLDTSVGVGSNDLFDELVAEWKNRRSLDAFSDTGELATDAPYLTSQDSVTV